MRKLNESEKVNEIELRFCETRSKRSIEVYRGKNLHLNPVPPPIAVTEIVNCHLINIQPLFI